MAFFSRAASRKFKGKKEDNTPILPEAMQSFIARRMTDAGGAVLVLAGGLLSLALLSFDARDPSINMATTAGEINNLLGARGAKLADMLLQTLGLASYLLAVAFITWGARIILRKDMSALSVRLPFLAISVLAGAVMLARIPAFDSWGIGAYLGGSAGSLIFTTLGNLLQNVLGQTAFVFVALAGFAVSAVTFMLALGLTFAEWGTVLTQLRNRSAIAWAKIITACRRFRHWHNHYSTFEEEAQAEESPAAQRRAIRVRMSEEKPAAIADPTEQAEALPRRKPVVAAPAAKPKPAAAADTRQKKLDLRASDDEWQLPSLDLLEDRTNTGNFQLDEAALHKNAEMLQSTLRDFGVEGDILKVNPGPIVTLYEMEPAPGTKTSRVIGLSDDIARSMSAVSARIAVVPGKNAIGIELPNARRETVFLKEMLASRDYEKTTARLPLILGKNISGEPIIADLAKMPHLLVAGTTGSGKSVAVNTMILSLLYRLSPEQCRFIMIDPKMLELSVYDNIPHLLTPVVTEPHRAVSALKWAVREMEDRYRAMSKLGVRNIDGFNERIRDARDKGEVLMQKIQTGFDSETGKPVFEEQPLPHNELPYIVVIVDEFADLMLVAGKEVEGSIQRLAQMARAAGIHLIMATQRPSVDVITGVIKANFPTRISFQVTSRIDSRTILGDGGAEQLLGQGDMLYMAAGGRLTRVHGPFVADDEVEKTVKYLRAQGEPTYIDGVTEEQDDQSGGAFGSGGDSGDELYDQACALIIRERKVSTSFIQRHLQIGYNRAARIIERMEKEGLITAANHVGKREILGGGGNYGT